MQEVKNECQDCEEQSWDNHVWDQCPSCKSDNILYKIYTVDDEEF